MAPALTGLVLPVPSLEVALSVMQRLAALTVLVDALEILARRSDFGPRGVFHADVIRAQERWTRSGMAEWIMTRLLSTEVFMVMVVAQAVAGGVMLLGQGGWVSTAALVVALAGRLVLNLRTTFGLDGSDQMIVVVLAALTLARVTGGDVGIAGAGMVFVAAQVVIAYLTAGVAKLVSPIWTRGEAIPAILRTESYGTESAGIWLQDRPAVARLLCLSVVFVECVLPFAFLLGVPGAWAFVVGGGLFHLGVAALMGLNSFVWSFFATFPAVLYAASLLEDTRWLGGHAPLAGFLSAGMLLFAVLLGATLGQSALPSVAAMASRPGEGEPRLKLVDPMGPETEGSAGD